MWDWDRFTGDDWMCGLRFDLADIWADPEACSGWLGMLVPFVRRRAAFGFPRYHLSIMEDRVLDELPGKCFTFEEITVNTSHGAHIHHITRC